MIKEAINKLAMHEDLNDAEMSGAMREIMEGNATNAQIASLITALRMKGETIEEITACARVTREMCTRVTVKEDVLEIVGTGGDCANTFNISTTSAFVIAAAGVKVAKHGNRSVSSKSGAADVLEALGAYIELDAAKNEELLAKINMCFLFAQKYHASMRFAGPVRKEIGIRTVFNIIGPLSNPAFASIQLFGVYDKALVNPLARVLSNLGVKRGMVVYSNDGLDELTVSAANTVVEIDNGTFKEYELEPLDLGLPRCSRDELVGGLANENAVITKNILSGKERGAKRNVILLNAGAGLYLAGKGTMKECVKLAEEMIDSGKALKVMEKFVEMTNALK
ncbi:MAG: anthranilate phosphoribosyltransferase [Phascolarctobacterium sp.]|nr:anthranilate phosphoribosyltransferase [Phascolarctobacterium sp.]